MCADTVGSRDGGSRVCRFLGGILLGLLFSTGLWASPQQGAAGRGGERQSSGPPVCDEQAASPAYPKLNADAATLGALFQSPRNARELLTNLKLVLDRRLLAEPAFYSDAVLNKFFAARSIEWVHPGTPGFHGDGLVRPQRIARVTVGIPGLEGMGAAVGVNHKCLPERADPTEGGKRIDAHTYDAGYIDLTLPSAARLRMGAVFEVFGHEPGRVDRSCAAAPFLSYSVGVESERSLNDLMVMTDRVGPAEDCSARQSEPVRHSDPVRSIVLRLLEDDRTFRAPPQP